MALLSVVIPSCNEEEMLPRAAGRISEILIRNEISAELIFVDDGSSDRTWDRIEEAARGARAWNAQRSAEAGPAEEGTPAGETAGAESPGEQSSATVCIRGIQFSRNFGKEAAILAGLAAARGDCAAVMDCDLQHPPETLVEMYRLWEQGWEVVEGVKRSRGKESHAHAAAAGTFYRIMSRSVGIDMSEASDFKLLDRRAVDVLLRLPERHAFFRALSSWIGFRSVSVPFDVQEREEGRSKWSTRGLIRYAVTNITAFSAAPMTAVIWLGVGFLVFAFVLAIQTLIRYFRGSAVEGFTTVILLLLFLGSLILLSLGVIGYYISRIYEEVKGRPRYIISRTVDTEETGGK